MLFHPCPAVDRKAGEFIGLTYRALERGYWRKRGPKAATLETLLTA